MNRTVIALLTAAVLGTTACYGQAYFNRDHSRSHTTSSYGDSRRGYNDRRYGSYDYWQPQYKGFLEAGFAGAVSETKAPQLDVLTTHGFQVSQQVFVGIGAGVSVQFLRDNTYGRGYDESGFHGQSYYADYHTTNVNIPLYADLRYTPMGLYRNSVQPFFDVRMGVNFGVGERLQCVGYGYIDSDKGFYFSPSIGVRIPVGYKNAVNIGLTYNLSTAQVVDWDQGSNYNAHTVGFGTVGARISYEW